jgi:hypothetical protein
MNQTSELPNKKYDLVEYPFQRVFDRDHKISESKQKFETLSTQDQEKYNQAYAKFIEKAKKLGYREVDQYDIFIVDERDIDAQAAYHSTEWGENYISISDMCITVSNELSIIKALFHELVGHCLSSKNLTKASDNLVVKTMGLSVLKFKEANYIKITKEKLASIQAKLNIDNDFELLDRDDKSIVENLVKITGFQDKSFIINYFVDNYDSSIHLLHFLKNLRAAVNGIDRIGVPLNEGVTDYIAINMSIDNFDEFWELVDDSPYVDYILPLVNMQRHLMEIGVDPQAWDDCLYDARLAGQPYKIIKFLKYKTGVSITPKELFALDFSKILGVDEKK